jgi:Uri superfamily endonuclease
VKGCYVLILRLPESRVITIGSRPQVCFPDGFYAYVGSAMSGLEARIKRHLKPDKKLHWHIDHLLRQASINKVIMAENGNKFECDLARALNLQFECIRGFGASDCRCPGHLFRDSGYGRLKSAVIDTLQSMALTPRWLTPVRKHDRDTVNSAR